MTGEGVHRRKRTRLRGYDYSQDGVYFLTICAQNHAKLFSQICVGGGVPDAPCTALTEYGEAIRYRLEAMDQAYAHMTLMKYVIMPNHIHLMLQVTAGPSGTPAPARDRANELIPAYVSTLKRMTNRACGRNIWQRGYHDHIIRGESDFLRVWRYIDANPARWAEDRYYAP